MTTVASRPLSHSFCFPTHKPVLMHSRTTCTSVLRPTSTHFNHYFDSNWRLPDLLWWQRLQNGPVHGTTNNYMFTAYILQYAICCIFVPSIKTASTQQLCDISSAFVLETGMRGGFWDRPTAGRQYEDCGQHDTRHKACFCSRRHSKRRKVY